jgi:hypothetical protein
MANGMSGNIYDFFTFISYFSTGKHINDGIGYCSAVITEFRTVSQNDRYNIALRAPHSACISVGVENWTFEYLPLHVRTSENVLENPGFDYNDTWIKPTGWTISGGKAHKVAGTANTIYQTGGIVIGEQYYCTFTISDVTAGSAKIYCGGSTGGTARTADGTYSETLTCAGSDLIGIYADSSFAGSVDNVSVRKLAHSWTIENDTIDGDLSKCLLCGYSKDMLYIKRIPHVSNSYDFNYQTQVTAAKFAYGTWMAWFYHQAGTHQEWMFVASQAGPASTSGNDGYEVYMASTEDATLYKVTNNVRSVLDQSVVTPITTGWNKVEITRAANGLITVQFNDSAFGELSATDTTYTTSEYNNIKLESGDKVALCTLEDERLYTYEAIND